MPQQSALFFCENQNMPWRVVLLVTAIWCWTIFQLPCPIERWHSFLSGFITSLWWRRSCRWSASWRWPCPGLNRLLLPIVVVVLVAALGSSPMLVPELCQRKLPQKSLFLDCRKRTWECLKWVHNWLGIVGLDTAWDRLIPGCVHWLIYYHIRCQHLVCLPVFTLFLHRTNLLLSWCQKWDFIIHAVLDEYRT